MRLCYIADANSIHTKRWIEPFTRGGHEIRLVSYRPNTANWQGLEALVDLTTLGNVPKLRFLHWGIWLRRYVREQQPDILHAHQIQGAGWLGALAGYHPFVVSAWGSDVLIEPHKSRFRRYLVDYVLRRADCVTAPSGILYNALLDLDVPKDRLELIPWGINTDVFSPEPKDDLVTRRQLKIDADAWVVLSPRGISPVYNHHIVIEAMETVAKHISNLCLVMIRYNVDASYQHKIEKQIAAADLTEKVLWIQAQSSPTEMARLYRMADVAISIPASEGYGFSVYEALACGSPTVISDLPLFQEDLRDGVHVLKVPIEDPIATAGALLGLHTSPGLRNRLKANGPEYARQLDISERVNRSRQLYHELLHT
ncbi:MAG: glycosyltransferase family 4 protein [Anaerolineae bacterium]